ncbi:MAG: GAF domain-containing protein [Pseudomonadota bacterium]
MIQKALDQVLWFVPLAKEALRSDFSLLFLPSGSKNERSYLFVHQGPNRPIEHCSMPKTQTFCGHVVESCSHLDVGSIDNQNFSGPCTFMQAEEMQSYLGAPVRDQSGRSVASLSVVCRDARHWTQGEIHSLCRLADYAGQSLALAQR